MKLSTAIRRYDAQLRADGKSPHTRNVYLRDLEFFARWAGRSRDISKITPHHLNRYLTSRAFTLTPSGKPKQIASLNRSKSALRSFFRFLYDAGHLRENPARLVRSARCPQRIPSCLTEQEENRLLTTIKSCKTPIAERDHLMFALMLGTGIRLGSLVALNVGHVDLTSGTIRVKCKGNVEQLVFMNGGVKRLLKKHIAEHVATDPLFLSTRCNRIGSRQVQFRLEHWLRKAGITRRCTVHTLRHSFATRLYEKTGDLRLVQRALGHRHITTTEVYTTVSNRAIARAVRRLNHPV